MEKEPSWADSFKLVGQLGFEIAIPLVAFALGGRWVDKYLNTSPLFLLLGMSISVVLTTFLVARRIKRLL